MDDAIKLVGSIVVTYVLALPLGWERKQKSEAYVGLRVFPLVAVGACVYVFLGRELFTGEDTNEQSDVIQGLMTGIGFIGAGAIIKQSDEVHGVATAAAIWTTGVIGAAVGYGYYVLALTICVVSLLILDVTARLARRVES